MSTMKTHAVEFSTAGGVEEIIRDPNPMPFFSIFLFVSCALFYSSSRYKDYLQR